MKEFNHKLLKITIKAFSMLPFFILDMFSFLNFIFMRYIFKYRLKLIKKNIHQSFPEKSKKEVNKITNKFYLHFSDLIFESLKVASFSEKQYKKHITYTNSEYLEQFYIENRNIVLLAGHFANWEWVSSLPMYTNYQLLAVYKPLKNAFWNSFIVQTRQRFNSIAVPMRNTFRTIFEFKNNNKLFILGLISDQCPPKRKALWSRFLDRDTAYFSGPEKISNKQNAVVLYLSVYKTKRHKYEATFKMITDSPQKMAEGEIIQNFSSILEKDVQIQPELYMWSHNRWKYKKEH